MKTRNNIKRLLAELGIKAMTPTPDLLEKRLAGMTLRRFNKIVGNSAASEPLTALEADGLRDWLGSVRNVPAADISLFDKEAAS